MDNFIYCTQAAPDYIYFIDIGAFFDRFGSAKFDVLTSTNTVVQAIIKDVQVRKWVDLRRPDVVQAVSIIATAVPTVTTDLVQKILHTPVDDSENLALRKLYF